tara:strand:- start:159 stop:1631 length:1473 start_codon:yes stop_codon:yes gene_type:complete
MYKNLLITSIDKYGDWEEKDFPGVIRGANSLFGTPDYDTTERKIYNSINIISIPSKMWGRKIQKNTFSISGSFYNGTLSKVLRDDGWENLYDTKFDSYDFIDNANRALYIAAQTRYKDYTIPAITTFTSNASGAIYLPNLQTNGITEDKLVDESHRYNEYRANNIKYSEGILGPKIDFDSTVSSSLEIYHNNNFNYNKNTDFAISYYCTANTSSAARQWLMVKSFAEDYIPAAVDTEATFELKQREFHPQYPFAFYIESSSIYFERNDGQNITTFSSSIDNQRHHIAINKTGSLFEFYKDGVVVASGLDNSEFMLQNKSNILIGSKNRKEGFYTGSMEHIMIFDSALKSTNITAISESIINTPNVGNVFYEHGFATITNPNYKDILFVSSSISHSYSIQFNGSHAIWENEYICNVGTEDFLYTNNITARKLPSDEVAELADFTTGSAFRPYVTAIGLYDNEGDLLAVGKLGQPVKMPNKIETNFIVRFDR